MKQKITFGVVLAYLWVMMILLGSIVFETFMIYPNIFHNPPGSLETAMEFMAIKAPSDFFPPLGAINFLVGIVSVILTWRLKSVRYWILGSILMICAEGLFSMAFFWPRNEIMFIEGTAMHSEAFLKQTAQEFQTLHWWCRFTPNVVGSILLFVGFLKLHLHKISLKN